MQRTTPFRHPLQNFWPLVHNIPSLVPRLNHSFYGDTVRCRTSRDAHGMTDGATTELEHHVLTEIVQQLMHLPGMNAA